MLQQKRNLINKDQRNEQSKCGEIHFLHTSLIFFCESCEFGTECYIKFKSHFDSFHKEDLTIKEHIQSWNLLQENPLKDSKDAKEVKEELDDPLNWIHTKEKEIKDILEDKDTKIYLLQNDDASAENETSSVATIIDEILHLESDLDKSDTNSNSSHFSEKQNEIEWSKPYQPRRNQIKRPYKPRDKLNTCLYCKRTFRRRAQLDNHENIHTGAKPHQCERCGKRFRAVTTLQRHLITHKKNKTLQSCKFCKMLFAHKPALLSHETRHTQERKFECDQCEKRFYTINQCDTHKRRVHHKLNNQTLPKLAFACDLCPNRYRSASMLSTHKLKKHLKTAKFTCEKCDKKFVDALKLEQHQKIHVSKNLNT